MTPEKIVKDQIKKYLKEIGAYYYMPVSFGYSSTSIDFLVCWKGKFYGIEAKREIGGRVSLRQKNVMQDIKDSGEIAVLRMILN